jgi:hypothetical protein
MTRSHVGVRLTLDDVKTSFRFGSARTPHRLARSPHADAMPFALTSSANVLAARRVEVRVPPLAPRVPPLAPRAIPAHGG